MQFNLEARYTMKHYSYIDQYGSGKSIVLCFTHATVAAVSGFQIDVEIDDFSSDRDGRSTTCVECYGGFDIAALKNAIERKELIEPWEAQKRFDHMRPSSAGWHLLQQVTTLIDKQASVVKPESSLKVSNQEAAERIRELMGEGNLGGQATD